MGSEKPQICHGMEEARPWPARRKWRCTSLPVAMYFFQHSHAKGRRVRVKGLRFQSCICHVQAVWRRRSQFIPLSLWNAFCCEYPLVVNLGSHTLIPIHLERLVLRHSVSWRRKRRMLGLQDVSLPSTRLELRLKVPLVVVPGAAAPVLQASHKECYWHPSHGSYLWQLCGDWYSWVWL